MSRPWNNRPTSEEPLSFLLSSACPLDGFCGIVFADSDIMDMVTNKLDRHIRRRLLTYLLENPDAKDTIDGISHLWLARSDDPAEISAVLYALDYFVGQGWLRTSRFATTKTLYWVNPRCVNDMRRALQDMRAQEAARESESDGPSPRH